MFQPSTRNPREAPPPEEPETTLRRLAAWRPADDPETTAEADRLLTELDAGLETARAASSLRTALERSALGDLGADGRRRLAPLLLAAHHRKVWRFVRTALRADLLHGSETPPLPPSAPDRSQLPILIAARDEAETLPRTLDSMLESIRAFRRDHRDVEVIIAVCDNASRDGTARVVLDRQDRFSRAGVSLHLTSETRPGKENATKRLLAYLAGRGWNPGRMVFADAEIDWTSGTLDGLWDYLDAHPSIEMVGGNILPRDGSLGPGNVWGILDAIPYMDYGGTEDHGRGRRLRFAIGMTYMARSPGILHRHAEIPPLVANEDVALNLLLGVDRVAVASEALIRYRACGTFRELVATRYRHVRGNLQLVDWMAAQEAVRWLTETWPEAGLPDPRHLRKALRAGRRRARRLVTGIVDMGTVSMARALLFETHRSPVQEPGGTVVLKRGRAVRLSPTHWVAIVLFMLPVYAAFKAIGRLDLLLHPDKTGWKPFRKRQTRDDRWILSG